MSKKWDHYEVTVLRPVKIRDGSYTVEAGERVLSAEFVAEVERIDPEAITNKRGTEA